MTITRSDKDMILNGYTLPVGKRTCIMGILNVTPDSFSDGGKYLDADMALEKAVLMQSQGADIIDIGGESSRPGSARISADEELARVMPVIKALKEKIKVPLSIDTYKSEVARGALREGVSMVNDITALRGDVRMAATIAEFDAAVVLMHMQGMPDTMQNEPQYDDVVKDIFSFLSDSVSAAEKAGIDPDKIVVDPGIGFGKSVEHNLMILSRLDAFKELGKPVLVGISRKSFLGGITGRKTGERLAGTAAGNALAIFKGADIIRVHDVADMHDAACVADAIMRI